jgi:hypothetical protein
MTNQTIKFLDGPLAGHVHKVKPGWPVPDRCGQRDPLDPKRVHFYRVIEAETDYEAYFDQTEERA